MKSLQETINESLGMVNEGKYQPSQSVEDWAKVLEALKSQAEYSNYSQTGLETNFSGRAADETLDEWIQREGKRYEAAVKAMGGDNEKARAVLLDIMSFEDAYYGSGNIMSYMGDDGSIARWKKKHAFKTNTTDFGIEEEDYYMAYKYSGPAGLKKYAQVIAEFSDCTDDYDDYED